MLIRVSAFAILVAVTACGSTGDLVSSEPTPVSVERAATQRAVVDAAAISHYFTTGDGSKTVNFFREVACDFGEHANSKPWFNGGFPRKGQSFFVPDAKGTRLKNGTRHQGFFSCETAFATLDRGPVAIYVGDMAGAAAARSAIPFRFAKSVPGQSVEIVVFP